MTHLRGVSDHSELSVRARHFAVRTMSRCHASSELLPSRVVVAPRLELPLVLLSETAGSAMIIW
jgi:hypothetical protein